MSALLLDTDDLSEAEATLSAAFSKIRIRATPPVGSTQMRILRTDVGAVAIDDADCGCDYDYDYDYDMEPPEQIMLCRVASGGLEERLPHAEPRWYGPGDVGAFGSLGQPFSGHVHRGHYDQLVIPHGVLDRVATGLSGNAATVRLTGSQPVSPEANRHLSACIEYVRHSVATLDYNGENCLLASALEHYVATVMLATLPNDAVQEPTIADRHDSSPVLLRRAMAYIDDNADADITLTDIASAVYVTPRALQYMFRKHRDCTPMEHLRRVRLHSAHVELVAGNRATTSVSAVARRWGFGHVGRFAVYYREHYDQSPHVTLRG